MQQLYNVTTAEELQQLENAIYKAYNADRRQITTEQHELIYKYINKFYAQIY
jgi:hypothetical protein